MEFELEMEIFVKIVAVRLTVSLKKIIFLK